MSLQVVTPPQHFCAGQQAAVADECMGGVAGLGGPDGFLQPAHQRQIVGQAAHQRHGRVAVEVDQPGGDDVFRKADGFGGVEAGSGLVRREDGRYAPVTDGDAVMFEGGVVRLDRDEVSGFDQQIDRDRRHGTGSVYEKPRCEAGFSGWFDEPEITWRGP